MRFCELRRPGLTKSIVTPAYCLLDTPACRGASGDSGRMREEARGSPVGARGRRCRTAPGPAHADVRGEERAEPDLVGRPGRPEIRRRTGGATDSIGRGPADLVREMSGPRGGRLGGLGGIRPWGLGGPFWAWACDGDLIAKVTAEQRGRPAAGLGGGPSLVRADHGRRHNRPALYSSGTEEKEEAQSAR
ncbi:hypothetical protein NDU88_000890 [Pleurodeles waltl]|uniref:Uncharacterized protein n=1 Tax=Pleurodeles waltl TaxID=8319 RepID=A0AAV7TGR2_PLEWA|nr:hypothetical protein NDU88_000890 [Pleurodeles waltl]